MIVRPRVPGHLPRTALVLIVLTLAGLALAFAQESARSAVLGLSLLALDATGLVFSLRAARHPGARTTWRLAAAGRGLSLVSTVTYTLHELTGVRAWWWAGVLAGITVFGCLGAAALSVSAQRLERRQRLAFLAEVVTVLGSGFVVVWYFVLEPVLQGPAGLGMVYGVGYPVGNLLLLVAVSAVLLRGAVARLNQALTTLLVGQLLYAVGDLAFTAVRVNEAQASLTNPFTFTALVLGSLVMTVGAIHESAGGPGTTEAPGRGTSMPAWSMHLPYVAVVLGNALLLVAAIRENAFLLWGGLSIGQAAMTSALAARQLISLQDSRRQNVTDTLTRLANVAGLRKELEQALHRREPVALMLLDLDGFKQINDRLGHDTGDRVLAGFAALLRQSVRRGDVPARVGGDEFVVLLRDVTGDADVAAVASRVLATLAANPLELAGESITVRCSIGVAPALPGDTARELQHRADVAMYESKRSGTHGCRVYHPRMTDRRNRDAALADALAGAVDTDQFRVAYQPLVDLGTGHAVAVEALLRWEHPELGTVSPAEFVPIAERTGAINALGTAVLEEACTQVQEWRETLPGAGALYASVNVSARQLQEASFLPGVRAVLDRTGLPAAALVLEITESAIVDEEVAIPALEALRELGIRVAVDDFGTGYSSLHLLTRLPVDILKIDRSFVASLDGTLRGAGVAEAVIRLARVLGLTTVAEGIESTAQVAELQMLGCSVAQGYLFARPMPAADFTAAMTEGAEVPAP